MGVPGGGSVDQLCIMCTEADGHEDGEDKVEANKLRREGEKGEMEV